MLSVIIVFSILMVIEWIYLFKRRKKKTLIFYTVIGLISVGFLIFTSVSPTFTPLLNLFL